MSKQLAVLVLSCDKYRDSWDPFFGLFFYFWHDCPYKVYLGTNTLDYDDERVQVIKVGDDSSWEDSVRKMLSAMEEDYVLPFYEDFFISRPISSQLVARAFEFSQKENIACFRFVPRMHCVRQYSNEKDIFYISPQDEYCVNAGANIWKKETYLSLLKPGFTAWDFEVKNSQQCHADNELPGVFVTLNWRGIYIKQGIIQGKWNPVSVRFCKNLGIKVDTSMRATMSFSETAWQGCKYVAREFFPSPIRKLIKRLMIAAGFGKGFVADY